MSLTEKLEVHNAVTPVAYLHTSNLGYQFIIPPFLLVNTEYYIKT
jgi:hypothetical protein